MATAPHSLASLAEISKNVADWVDSVAALTQPDNIYWCDGSQQEFQRLRGELSARSELLKLNQESFPGCFLYRSNPNDVARVEHVTFICSRSQDDAGPNNHWMEPTEAHAKMRELFQGCMRGRTLYVVPYCMGVLDSPYSRCGVEITDSAYVVLNMAIMTRMGRAALERIATEGSFVRGLHSIGDLNPSRRFIMHYPEELAIESFGSGYGGNALLGKKCHALRIASWQARDEGWLADADRRAAEPSRPDSLHRRGIPIGVWQDQSCDAHPARLAAGLESLHRRRRYRLAAPGPGWAALGDQPGGGPVWRRARHQPEDQSQRLRDHSPRHLVYQRRTDRR
jgi:hypothetical protein